jgi:hypothetical protein
MSGDSLRRDSGEPIIKAELYRFEFRPSRSDDRPAAMASSMDSLAPKPDRLCYGHDEQKAWFHGTGPLTRSLPRGLLAVAGVVFPVREVHMKGEASDREDTAVTICIPSSVESFCHHCFEGCSRLSDVAFESDSRLARIEKAAFLDCRSLSSICFPSSLCQLDDFALLGVRLQYIALADGNDHFTVIPPFLMDADYVSIHKYCGTATEVTVGQAIETLCCDSFAGAQ